MRRRHKLKLPKKKKTKYSHAPTENKRIGLKFNSCGFAWLELGVFAVWFNTVWGHILYCTLQSSLAKTITTPHLNLCNHTCNSVRCIRHSLIGFGQYNFQDVIINYQFIINNHENMTVSFFFLCNLCNQKNTKNTYKTKKIHDRLIVN